MRKYKVTVYTYDDDFAYSIEAETAAKAKYKCFKEAKASGDFAACMTNLMLLRCLRTVTCSGSDCLK